MPATFTRRKLIAATAACIARPMQAGTRDTRSFWLFKLLNPAAVVIRPAATARLHCASADRRWIIEGGQSLCVSANAQPVRITGPADNPVNCVLEVPNLIRRSYFGVFTIGGDGYIVRPVVIMPCEVAAGCIVGAELPVARAPLSALAAQAVVSRSVICGTTGPRHQCADFCDTTHCQFLRSPATPGSSEWNAVRETAGIVLLQRGAIMPARYSAACGGTTEAGVDGSRQYVSVTCEICRNGNIARRGHGWGLCQEGAIGLARLGWSWRAILAKYYPNATAS